MGEILYQDDKELTLLYDDDGEYLYIGDRVLVNYEIETVIEGNAERRWLKGITPSTIVESVERIAPPMEDAWPEDVDL